MRLVGLDFRPDGLDMRHIDLDQEPVCPDL